MQYSAPRFPAIFQSRGVLIAAAALVVIAIIVVVFFVMGRNAQPAEDDVSQLPVSGITDTTGTDDEQEAEAAQVEVAPTSARVVYNVASGDDCYIETYTDGGDAVGELLSGPAQNTIEVTGTWTITTWSPDTIKLTVNSEDVQLTASSEYGGMYAYTVDFPAILEEWKKTHTSKSSQREAAVATASNAANSASSSSSAASESSTSASASASALNAQSATTSDDSDYLDYYDSTYDDSYQTYDDTYGTYDDTYDATYDDSYADYTEY